jgi:hypothetical protein
MQLFELDKHLVDSGVLDDILAWFHCDSSSMDATALEKRDKEKSSSPWT